MTDTIIIDSKTEIDVINDAIVIEIDIFNEISIELTDEIIEI